MYAALFPGQGSQKPGMGRDLFEHSPVARATFEDASAAVGQDLAKLCFESSDDELRQTQNAQLALFVCGVAAYRAFREAGGPAPGLTAGHSVGEYAAMVAAGALDLADGARLVQRRGDLMARLGNLRPGGMAAIIGLERDAVEAACKDATPHGIAVIANDNCPGQLVISGDLGAVTRAGELAKEAGAKLVVALNVSGAFHSPLMAEAARAMGEALRHVEFRAGDVPVISNVTASPVADPALWPTLLESQLESTVRWTESMQFAVSAGTTAIAEFGVGNVLCGLMKRIDRGVRSFPVHDAASLQDALAQVGV